MAKYYGAIGFAVTEETRPGVWTNKIVERYYKGDAIKIDRRLQTTDHANDDINVSNRISIVADNFAEQNFIAIRYVSYAGARWKVTDVEPQHPRLILTLGGLFNGYQT